MVSLPYPRVGPWQVKSHAKFHPRREPFVDQPPIFFFLQNTTISRGYSLTKSQPPLKVGGGSIFVFLRHSIPYLLTIFMLVLHPGSDSDRRSHSKTSTPIKTYLTSFIQSDLWRQPHRLWVFRQVRSNETLYVLCGKPIATATHAKVRAASLNIVFDPWSEISLMKCLCLYRGRMKPVTALQSILCVIKYLLCTWDCALNICQNQSPSGRDEMCTVPKVTSTETPQVSSVNPIETGAHAKGETPSFNWHYRALQRKW